MRVAPIGSSAGELMRRPVAICSCVRASRACASSSSPSVGGVHAGRGHPHAHRPHRPEQRVEQRVGDPHHLGRRLVGLLVAQQVGRFLVEVHARYRFDGAARASPCTSSSASRDTAPARDCTPTSADQPAEHVRPATPCHRSASGSASASVSASTLRLSPSPADVGRDGEHVARRRRSRQLERASRCTRSACRAHRRCCRTTVDRVGAGEVNVIVTALRSAAFAGSTTDRPAAAAEPRLPVAAAALHRQRGGDARRVGEQRLHAGRCPERGAHEEPVADARGARHDELEPVGTKRIGRRAGAGQRDGGPGVRPPQRPAAAAELEQVVRGDEPG